MLQLAGINDCFTQSNGSTKTKGNFLYAVYLALRKTYTYLTPEFWGEPKQELGPHETFAEDLKIKA